MLLSVSFFMNEEIKIVDTLIETLQKEKDAANEHQERKHDDWNDIYELYRNKVKINRLTQRQSVNIPLMKETIKTILSKIDDAPIIEWKDMGGDEDKEILFQEMWEQAFKENRSEHNDIVDKKNVLLYGISTKKLNITDSGISIDTLDPYDVVFDPLMTVADVESARFIIHQNIFRSARDILADDRYSKDARNDLKMWLNTTPGITQGNDNKKIYERKMERLEAMGVDHKDFPMFAGGDRLINLTEHYTSVWNNTEKDWERRVIVYADDEVILMDEKLEDLIGVTFWPFVNWVEDPETTDIYSDSVADLVRTPNKVINVWYSQLVENRTLKNFQMHWYMPNQNYSPQTYTPGPGVMLPAPPGDDISKVIKPVEISGLDDTMIAIEALTKIVERATGATAIEKGEGEQGQQTLGEIEILVGKSVERAIGMAKFYRLAWYETAVKWHDMMHENKPKVTNLYKISGTGKVYTKKAYASDWASQEGYEPIITSTSEQEQNEVKSIQKWQFILSQHGDIQALRKLALKRELELLDLTSDELQQVMDEMEGNEQKMAQAMSEATGQPQAQGQPVQQGADPGVVNEIQQSLQELGA